MNQKCSRQGGLVMPAPASSNWGERGRYLLAYAAAAGAGVVVTAGSAEADFVGPYALANWTLTNTNADGFITNLGGSPISIQLTGGDNGSVLAGDTDFTIAAVAAGVVSFHWGYTSADSYQYDTGGFLLNGVYTQLADNDTQVPFFDGVFTLPVSAGDSIGFRVHTKDNQFGPGNFGVTNFNGPTGEVPVPEPSTLALLAL